MLLVVSRRCADPLHCLMGQRLVTTLSSTFWYNFGMFRRADTLSSNPDAHPATQAAWPDDLAAFKALLRAQQQASAEREAQLLQRFDQREQQLQQTFAHREQQLQQAFDARVIELY